MTRFLYFLLFFCVCCSSRPGGSVGKESTSIVNEVRLQGKAVKIVDGDTFDLLGADNTITRIRLHGIDCPERRQDFSNAAKEYLSGMIFSKKLLAVKKDTDRYGRTVAIVFVDSVNVNEAMLKAGLAWHFKRYDKNPAWARMEEFARTNRIGLWSGKDAVAPWEWRNRQKVD